MLNAEVCDSTSSPATYRFARSMGRLDPDNPLLTIVRESAAATLPGELARLGPGVGAVAEAHGATPDTLVEKLTDLYIEPLLNPLGTAKPKLTASTPTTDARAMADLYWRCLVAMQMMPLASFKALARHHSDLQAHLPAAGDDERRGYVTALLPRFAMTCITEEEAAAAAERRKELDEIKKEREKVEAEEKAAEEAAAKAAPPAAAPTVQELLEAAAVERERREEAGNAALEEAKLREKEAVDADEQPPAHERLADILNGGSGGLPIPIQDIRLNPERGDAPEGNSGTLV